MLVLVQLVPVLMRLWVCLMWQWQDEGLQLGGMRLGAVTGEVVPGLGCGGQEKDGCGLGWAYGTLCMYGCPWASNAAGGVQGGSVQGAGVLHGDQGWVHGVMSVDRRGMSAGMDAGMVTDTPRQ